MSWTQKVKKRNDDVIIALPTNDKYDKSQYHWDKQLKKVVYTPNKKKENGTNNSLDFDDKIKRAMANGRSSERQRIIRERKKNGEEHFALNRDIVIKAYEHGIIDDMELELIGNDLNFGKNQFAKEGSDNYIMLNKIKQWKDQTEKEAGKNWWKH